MSTGLIIGWTYKNGELAKSELDNWIAGLATLITFLITFIVVYPALQTNIPFTGKISKFLLLLALLLIGGIAYYILQFFSGSLFVLYKKIKKIKEQEILFTDNKITSTGKTWILNDAVKKLDSVNFASTKHEELVFKGTETKPGKSPTRYTIRIPIPKYATGNAETILLYFKKKLMA